jgi:hypothetical protein
MPWPNGCAASTAGCTSTGIAAWCDEQDRPAGRESRRAARDEAIRSAFISYGVRQKIDTGAIRRAKRVRPVKLGCQGVWGGVGLGTGIVRIGCVLYCLGIGRHGEGERNAAAVVWGILQFFGIICCAPDPYGVSEPPSTGCMGSSSSLSMWSN